jgi:hypothetical protein
LPDQSDLENGQSGEVGMNTMSTRRALGMPANFWSQHREASLNWLALGLLLAAWNAADDGDSLHPRPAPLRAYAHVTVRAVARNEASAP